MSVKLVCFSCFSNYNTHVSATDMVGKSECLDGLRNCWSPLHHQRIGSLKFKNKRMKKYLTYQEVFTVWDEEIALVKQIFFFVISFTTVCFQPLRNLWNVSLKTSRRVSARRDDTKGKIITVILAKSSTSRRFKEATRKLLASKRLQF